MARLMEVGGGSREVRMEETGREWRDATETLLKERRLMVKAPPVARQDCSDPVDEACEREEEAVWLAILDCSRDMQATVQEALRRLATGEYGLCKMCGQHIALARLRALPFAVRCLACQERLEREGEVAARRSAGRVGFGSRDEGQPPDPDQRLSCDLRTNY